MTERKSISIAIVTFQRPSLLARALEALKAQSLPDADVRLIVIDNDAVGSAKAIVDAAQMPFAVEYAVEPKKGIPHARNRALTMAENSDYLAFIDDDDIADSRWLEAMYKAAQAYNADVVQGFVGYVFPPANAHLAALDIFANPTAATGEPLDAAWTNNVLFSTRIYRETGLAFDNVFAESGGSDHHFFRTAKAYGASIVMYREAIVTSPLPAERLRFCWLMRRNIRIGAALSMSDRMVHENSLPAVWSAQKYVLTLLGKGKCLAGFLAQSFVFGRIAGLFNLSPREYR